MGLAGLGKTVPRSMASYLPLLQDPFLCTVSTSFSALRPPVRVICQGGLPLPPPAKLFFLPAPVLIQGDHILGMPADTGGPEGRDHTALVTSVPSSCWEPGLAWAAL